jgi:hypothetical protein
MVKTYFARTWILVVVKEVGNKFCARIFMQANPYKYMGMNLGCRTISQCEVQQHA